MKSGRPTYRGLDSPTLERSELVGCLESSRLEYVVGPERDSEERPVRQDRADEVMVFSAAQPFHLAVDQVNVEVGKLDVIALSLLQTSAVQSLGSRQAKRQTIQLRLSRERVIKIV